MKADFFSRGGTLSADAPSYLERLADAQLLDTLLKGEYALVLDSRQKGKSSLLARTAFTLRQKGYLTLKIDLQGIGSRVTELQWYAALTRTIGEQVHDLPGAQAHWQDTSIPSPAARWFAYVEHVAASHGPTALFIDEVDFVRSMDFDTDEFFAIISAAYNRRTQHSPVLCLAGTATPSLLLRKPFPIHFILGQRILLSDFSLADLSGYASVLGSNKILRQIHDWTGGQPYLTQVACADRLLNPEGSIETYFREQFVVPRMRQQNDHIASLAFALSSPTLPGRTAEEARTQVLDAYLRVLHPTGVSMGALTPEVVDHLLLTGVAKQEHERLVVRNRLYREALGRQWTLDQLSGQEKARQRRAARRATLLTAGVSLLVLGVVGAFALSSANLARRLGRALSESQANARRAQEEAYVGALQSIGMEAQDGNSMRAGLLLRQVKDSPFRGWEWHRIRRDLSQHDRLIRLPSPAINWRESAEGRLTHAVTPNEIFDLSNPEAPRRVYQAPEGYEVIRTFPEGLLFAGGDQPATQFADWSGNGRAYDSFTFPWKGGSFLKMDIPGKTARWFDKDSKPLGPVLSTTSGAVSPGPQVHQAVLRIAGGLALADMATGRIIQRFSIGGYVSDLRFDRTASRLIVATDTPEILVFSVQTGKEVGRLVGNAGPVRGLAMSPDGSKVASAGADGSVRLFDLGSLKQIRAYMGHENRVQNVGFSQDGLHLISAGFDQTIRTWKLNPELTDLRLNGPENGVARLRFARAGAYFVAAFDDGSLKFWKPGSAQPDRVLKLPERGPVLISQFDGQDVEGVTEGGLAFRTQQGSVATKSFGQAVGIVTLADKDSVWVAFKDGRLVQASWSTSSKRELRPRGPVCSVMASSKDKRHTALGFENGTVELWQTEPPRLLHTSNASKKRILSLEFAPNGSRFVASSLEGTVYEHRVGPDPKTVALSGHTARVWRAHYSPDGRTLATSSFDNSARLWESGTGKPLFDLQLKSWVGDVQFSPDGKRLLTACGDGTARLWSVSTARELLLVERSAKPLFGCRMTDDGNWIITSDSEGRIRAWNGSP